MQVDSQIADIILISDWEQNKKSQRNKLDFGERDCKRSYWA